MDLLTHIQTILHDSSIIIEQHVQTLWSGYGQIIRCKSQQKQCSYIVKEVRPTKPNSHPRGWNTSASHDRKLASYQVEASFYQYYAQQTDEYCKVPLLIAGDISEHSSLLIMEDLNALGFSQRKKQAQWNDLARAIKWLAYFHARFMGNKANKLWPIGSYWHLATRQDELSAMPESQYKNNAQLINQVLHNARFKTLIHGDAKFENLCFHENNHDLAAVDFQYVGKGTGVKDLMYLAGSCLSNEQLFEFDDLILKEYLLQINNALNHYEIALDINALTDETIRLYPVAWADFYRFLLGWNPNSWKICPFMQQKAQQGLEIVKSH